MDWQTPLAVGIALCAGAYVLRKSLKPIWPTRRIATKDSACTREETLLQIEDV